METWKGRGILLCGSFFKWIQKSVLANAKARSQETYLGLLDWWWKPKYLDHFLLLSKEHQQEGGSEVEQLELGLKGQYEDAHRILRTNSSNYVCQF